MDSKKRIAVIGGGFSGIGSCASLKEEGLEPICFEKTDQYGGTWYYRDYSEDGLNSIMPTTIINTSKEFGSPSNFPLSKECNNYMSHQDMYNFLTEYMKHFDVERHIRYNSEVTEVKKADDYEETGRWAVTVKNLKSERLSTDIYDGVLVCVGHLSSPIMPNFPGQEIFKGTIMHTHRLKEVSPFKDQKVVVVGIGCSALDAAVEISTVAKQVYLSTRSGAFVISRKGPRGYPIDYFLMRRYITTMLDIFPVKFCSWVLEKLLLNFIFDQDLYYVKPKHSFLGRDPCLNDYFASKLLSGAIIQKRNIAYFAEHGVVFEGESEVTEADSVIMGTGYSFKFRFLEDGILTKENGRINLYKCMFPTQLIHSTLAFIGFFLPFGPGIPIGEMQTRWAAHVLSGKGKLPSNTEMLSDVEKRYNRNMKRYKYDEKLTIKVDYVQYMDELASQFGAKPNFLKMFFTDIWLFLKLWFGPCVSYQYRLQGPHKWEGARDAIMTASERVLWPLTRGN